MTTVTIDFTKKYRHKKRGTIYKNVVSLQTSKIEDADNMLCILYQEVGEDKPLLYARPFGEFIDGRFEEVNAPD